MAALGRRLLEASALLVKPGGFVVYSTCTVTRAENQAVIEGFLTGSGGFRIDDLGDDLPAEWRGFVTGEGTFQSLPEPGGPDGHFAARLVRE
jgi:16S rRNA (cytosine967-C5)-methyltransferase